MDALPAMYHSLQEGDSDYGVGGTPGGLKHRFRGWIIRKKGRKDQTRKKGDSVDFERRIRG